MPDKRSHRGPHPADEKLFAPEAISDLRSALADYSLLLTKGYAEKSALKLVGDRFSLTQRQRQAVMRSACSDPQLSSRSENCIEAKNLAGQSVAVDGYNVLITVEAAMSGGVIFAGRDGCFRDLASIHGTYRKVTETIPAIQLIGAFLADICTDQVCVEGVSPSDRGRDARDTTVPRALWLLDSPVSNSGRLKTLIGELADQNNWDWEVELLLSPDAELIKTDLIVASSDSVILDGCRKWTNLATEIIEQKLPSAWIIDLAPDYA